MASPIVEYILQPTTGNARSVSCRDVAVKTKMPDGFTSVDAEPYTSPNRHRQGGVSLIIHPDLHAQHSALIPHQDYQVAYYRFPGGITIVSTYLRPTLSRASRKEVTRFLTRLTRGQAIILGDLNARNSLWDSKTTTNGTVIAHFATYDKFTVYAPREPTCRPKQHHGAGSTVNLFLSRNVSLEEPRVVPWIPSLDQRLVLTTVLEAPIHVPHVPSHVLQDQ